MSGTAGTSWTSGDTTRASFANSASGASSAMRASAGYSSRSRGGGVSPRLVAIFSSAQSRFTSGPPPPASPRNHRLVLGHRPIAEHWLLPNRAAGVCAACSSANITSVIGRSSRSGPSESNGTTPSLTAESSLSSEISKRVAPRVPRKPRPPKAATGPRLRGGMGWAARVRRRAARVR
jgi:hypothetical protein